MPAGPGLSRDPWGCLGTPAGTGMLSSGASLPLMCFTMVTPSPGPPSRGVPWMGSGEGSSLLPRAPDAPPGMNVVVGSGGNGLEPPPRSVQVGDGGGHLQPRHQPPSGESGSNEAGRPGSS